MAEAVLFNIAEEIIKKAGSHVLEEIGLFCRVKDELRKLKNTVTTIKAVLLDAEERSSENNQVKIWLGRLREVLYDADDLLDDFSTEVLQRQLMVGNKVMKEVRLFFSHSNQIIYGFKMGHKIKDLRDKLVEIKDDRDFHLDQRPMEKSVIIRQREHTHSSLPEIVVGRENDNNKIVEFLLSDEENLSIVSIVGLGGLGKTTVAQFAYNDDKVKAHFELKGWVCVSDNFDVKLTIEKLLESLTGKRRSNCEMDRLKNLLCEKINGKKYLIVLDDVWNEDPQQWFRLKDLLIAGAKGSKIMITTRLMTVARLTHSYVYELQGLSEIESWSLFKQMAFEHGQVPSPSHETIGKEIVAKCAGVPLAIRSIGGLLYCKATISEWIFFKDNELSKVNQQDGNILGTLKLSYNHLPSHLKHCFAYCSLFPKDYVIEVEKLIFLWMAQGYIDLSNSSQSFKEIGFAYFMDLLSGSFFQQVERDESGNIVCKMHDLMHDLAKLVAGDEIVTFSRSNVATIGKNTRHLSFVSREEINSLSSILLNARKTRTFLFIGSLFDSWAQGQWHGMFSKLKSLRMLDLRKIASREEESMEIEKVLDSIDKLKHLRYLDLSDNYGMKRLPNSITRLWNLQLLKLDNCWSVKELPNNINKLVNLKHLGLYGCDSLTRMPVGIGKLTCLENLCKFVVAKDIPGVGGLHELQFLNKLRGTLTISNLLFAGKNDFQAANLKEKTHLQLLRLEWMSCPYDLESVRRQQIELVPDDYYEVGANDVDNEETALEALRPHQNLESFELFLYRGSKCPSWLSSLTNLVKIVIFNCKNIQSLPALNHIPSLTSLNISSLTSLEYIDAELNSLFFPSLKHLSISNCPNLKGWNDDTQTTSVWFHCLRVLLIRSCPNLTSVPPFPFLKMLRLEKASMKILEQMLMLTMVYESESSSFSSQLEALVIDAIEDLDEFNRMPELLQPSLASLLHLKIENCSKIIMSVMQWEALRSLRSLQLYHIYQMVSLPEELQYVTTLQHLQINLCPNLRYLPEWMTNLSSLKGIFLSNCPRVQGDSLRNIACNITMSQTFTLEELDQMEASL